MDLMQQERFHEALLASASSPEPHEPDALLLRAMLLVNTGALGEAEALCGDILAVDDLHAGAHYIVAICREHAGDHSGAVEHSRAAAYLDPGFAMPHLQLGRIARRGGDLALAQRELDLALGLLPREDAARILLFGGGFKREGLIELCRGELRASGGER
jgi:chemotaxis protein methyltransferase CheR